MVASPKSVSPWILVLCLNVPATSLDAVVAPEKTSSLAEKQVRHPDLDVSSVYQRLDRLSAEAAAHAHDDLDRLGISPEGARLDPASGRWGTLLPTEPMLPGSGVGNDLQWDALGFASPRDDVELGQAAWKSFNAYLQRHRDSLRLDPTELSTEPRITVLDQGDLVQIHLERKVHGVPVRGSYLTAVISHGNLVLFGTHSWADVEASPRPRVKIEQAQSTLLSHLESFQTAGEWAEPRLAFVPVVSRIADAEGHDYRLTWVLSPEISGDFGHWQALVDAANSELLAFENTVHYSQSTREVRGGVYPLTNDGISPGGVEQPGWPMPFDEVVTGGGTVATDSGGNLPAGVAGLATSSLDGVRVRMNDNCGPISLSSTGDIDFGTSAGTDCVTPGFGGAGNTHASRTGFYELNRIKEMALGQLPANVWLQLELVANVNQGFSCGAFWNGTSVSFGQSNSFCSNLGEIAAVLDHEWGHGMDDNDANGFISNPGEGIADLYAALRLNDTCIGPNAIPGINCSGYGDPCIDCTGVRDIDWAEHVSGLPHDVAWAIATCGTIPHCRGLVYAEAVWDLFARDLQSAPYNLDSDTAREIVTRLTFLGSGVVGTWYQNVVPYGGCNADSGYLSYLAADDDNGNLNDGTPHMGAIFAAFDRHGAACDTPVVQDSGCATTPTVAPIVTAVAGDKSVDLSWTLVPGATEYEIFRTDGVFACDFGKVRVGSTSGTTFTDTGLQNDREYYYVVIPKGPAAACFGPSSTCTSVTPRSCCDQPLSDTEFFLSAPGNLSVSDSDYAYCAMAGAKHTSGSYCYGQHNGISNNWDFAAVGSAASCGFICIDQIANCPCDPFFEEFFLTGSSNQTLSGADYAYCALAGARHNPTNGYCWGDYNGVTDTWTLSSINSNCNFVCIPEDSTCTNFAFREFTLNGPAGQTLSDTLFSYCAVSGAKHSNAGYCWADHNTVAGTWQLNAVGQATCNFECIAN